MSPIPTRRPGGPGHTPHPTPPSGQAQPPHHAHVYEHSRASSPPQPRAHPAHPTCRRPVFPERVEPSEPPAPCPLFNTCVFEPRQLVPRAAARRAGRPPQPRKQPTRPPRSLLSQPATISNNPRIVVSTPKFPRIPDTRIRYD